MNERFGFDRFLSPFTWRYGSEEMREIFSEVEYRAIWRRIWVQLAEAQSDYGLVTKEEVEELRSKMGKEHVDLRRAHEWERRIRHDVMAEIKTFAEQCPKAGGKIHLGATSADVEDNADIYRMKKGLELILARLVTCLDLLTESIEKYKDLTCMAWTHLQPAEPTTLGYRLANYAQDLVLDIRLVEYLLKNVLRGKGVKGAVGTYASFKSMLKDKVPPSLLEEKVMASMGLDTFPVATQTYPRKVDYLVLTVLASVAQSAHKFAFDLRLMQSPAFGELAEPREDEQVGSTTMPFKRNPISAERICSLARYIGVLPLVAFTNASATLLERTLDDSANRRIIIPEGFLALDECLILYQKILAGLRVYPAMIKKNLERFGPFAGTEPLLMKLVEKGCDRQEMHELIRKYSLKAWESVMRGEENPIASLLKNEPLISSKLRPEEVDELLDPRAYIGEASSRCELFIKDVVRPILEKYKDKVSYREIEGF